MISLLLAAFGSRGLAAFDRWLSGRGPIDGVEPLGLAGLTDPATEE